jgi:hypothetical protein
MVIGAGAFLAAAKAHGRQLRIERELAGYFQVRFGGQNPEWVEAFWRRERAYFWGSAVALALTSLAFRWLAARQQWSLPLSHDGGSASVSGALVLHALLPAVGAFVLTGLASALRTGLPLRDSAGWWILALITTLLLVTLAWRT